MDQPTVLRETKIGQKGFVKEDVLTYLDELNSKIQSLEDDLKNASGQKPADPQELIKYRNQVDNLQEKLNASNNALRAAKKENEELQGQIAKLKAGGPAAAGTPAANNAQIQAALDAAKKEIDSLKAQLRIANERANANSGAAPANNAQPALDAAKKEIENLKSQLRMAAQKVTDAEKKAAEAEKKAASSNDAKAAPAENKAAAEELTKLKLELEKTVAEVKAKSAELEAKIKESADKDSKIEQLTKENAAAAKKDEEIEKLNGEIKGLNDEIIQLRENANNPAALMGSLFAEAQKTVSQLKIQAEQEAAKTTKEASEKAEKVVLEANMSAEKTINEANKTAEKTIREANDQAKAAVDEANIKVDKLNEMSSTVRNMLLNEIESVNVKFNDLTNTINRLTSQASDKMNEAQTIIGEARKAVEPNEDNSIKRAEAPKANFNAAKAPAASNSDFNSVANNADNFGKRQASSAPNTAKENPINDPFAKVAGGSYNQGSANSFNKPQTPSPAPVHEAPKPAPKKPVNSFNFDMSELLKAAEAEAAKDNN